MFIMPPPYSVLYGMNSFYLSNVKPQFYGRLVLLNPILLEAGIFNGDNKNIKRREREKKRRRKREKRLIVYLFIFYFIIFLFHSFYVRRRARTHKKIECTSGALGTTCDMHVSFVFSLRGFYDGHLKFVRS
ncbi:hypothetical protein PUN28_017370 [Cardiocondyla obscurior]|uniref:Uncharacterized protein n=1 Tax=Cardiocondyla obscurior TaxID=286306 RepID=A0AAW2ENL2_9HYME